MKDNKAPEKFFDDYVKIGIKPQHIHKPKVEHEYAVMVLAWCISNVLANHGEVVPRKLVTGFKKLAQRCKREIH